MLQDFNIWFIAYKFSLTALGQHSTPDKLKYAVKQYLQLITFLIAQKECNLLLQADFSNKLFWSIWQSEDN